MRRRRKRKCLHCQVLFHPDPRNVRHQKYCSETECRKASKTASQRRWLSKEANKDYFRGPENVKRVQVWRNTHTGYWRSNGLLKDFALQDDLIKNTGESMHTYSGIGIYSPDFFLNQSSGSVPLAPIIRNKCNDGLVSGQLYDGSWTDVGTLGRLQELESQLN